MLHAHGCYWRQMTKEGEKLPPRPVSPDFLIWWVILQKQSKKLTGWDHDNSSPGVLLIAVPGIGFCLIQTTCLSKTFLQGTLAMALWLHRQSNIWHFLPIPRLPDKCSKLFCSMFQQFEPCFIRSTTKEVFWPSVHQTSHTLVNGKTTARWCGLCKCLFVYSNLNTRKPEFLFDGVPLNVANSVKNSPSCVKGNIQYEV